jgi:hypothetical protein
MHLVANDRSPATGVLMTWKQHGICQKSEKIIRMDNMKGCIQWTQRHMAQGNNAYLLTFMFERLSGSERAMVAQMERQIECFASRLLLRYNRKPNSIFHQSKTPKLYGFPDRPISKKEKISLSDVTLNDAIHYHMICLEPLVSRMPVPLDVHLQQSMDKYLRDSSILRIHAQLITHDEDAVTSYGLKAYSSGQFQHDDFLILPRSGSEMPNRSFKSFHMRLTASN